MVSRFAFDFLSAVVLGVTAAIGAYTPVYLARQDKLKGGTGRSFIYVLGNLFSAGVMVSAGFCHLLGEALKQMPKMQFPLAPFLCGTGYLLTLCADKFASSMSGMSSACHGPDVRETPVEVIAGLDLAERGTPKLLRQASKEMTKDNITYSSVPLDDQSSSLMGGNGNGGGGGSIRPPRSGSAPLPSNLNSNDLNNLRSDSRSSNGLGSSPSQPPQQQSQTSQQQQVASQQQQSTPPHHRGSSGGLATLVYDDHSDAAGVLKATTSTSLSGAAALGGPQPIHRGAQALRNLNSNGVGALEVDTSTDYHYLNNYSTGHQYNHNHSHHHGGVRQVSFLTAVLMGVALCFHSLLEGAAMGAQSTISNSLHIFIAIVSHKGLAAYALGSSIVDSDVEMKSFWSVIIPFTLASPVGIFIGYIISDIAQGVGAAAISALASGTFLYVAFMEVIPKELMDTSRIGKKLGALLLGFVLMSILAIWA